MSDRPCNFCDWQRMKEEGCRRATKADRTRLWEEDKEFDDAFGPGVLVVNKAGEFACWFMELPSHCCC